MQPQTLEQFTHISTTYNNIHGFTPAKIGLRKQIDQYRQHLCKLYGFPKVFYTNSTASFIESLFHVTDNTITCFEGAHPLATKLGENSNGGKLCAFITLTTSDTCQNNIQQISEARQQHYQHIICDCCQSIGRMPLPTSRDVDCVVVSPHKIGGMIGTCLIFMRKEFYDKFYPHHITEQYEDIDNEFLQFYPGTFNIAGFITSYLVCKSVVMQDGRQLKITHEKLTQMLQGFKEVKVVKNGVPHLYSSICFELQPPYCVRSLQNVFARHGVQIGFKTACQSGKDGVLRLSWRAPILGEKLTQLVKVMMEAYGEFIKLSNVKGKGDDDVSDDVNDKTLHGSLEDKAPEYDDPTIKKPGFVARHNKPLTPQQQCDFNFQNMNAGAFYLRHHWAKSHLKKWQPIPEKYKPMFPDFILHQMVSISLIIPSHELRRVSKNVYINNEKMEISLTLQNFEKHSYPLRIGQMVDGLYFMSGYMRQFIEKNKLDIKEEYARKFNPMSEFVLNIKVPIKEMLISTCNMYCNNRGQVQGESACKKQRVKFEEGEKKEKQKTKELEGKDDVMGDAEDDNGGLKMVGKYDDGDIDDGDVKKKIIVVQPFPTTKEMKKAIQVITKIRNKQGVKIVFIVQDKKMDVPEGFRELEEPYCCYENFLGYWMKFNYQQRIFVLNVGFAE